MNDEQEYKLLEALKEATKSNPEFFSKAVLSMQRGVDEHIYELKELSMANEMIAVAMHSKANDSRHTKKQKKWVDNIVSRYQGGRDGGFTNTDFTNKDG